MNVNMKVHRMGPDTMMPTNKHASKGYLCTIRIKIDAWYYCRHLCCFALRLDGCIGLHLARARCKNNGGKTYVCDPSPANFPAEYRRAMTWFRGGGVHIFTLVRRINLAGYTNNKYIATFPANFLGMVHYPSKSYTRLPHG